MRCQESVQTWISNGRCIPTKAENGIMWKQNNHMKSDFRSHAAELLWIWLDILLPNIINHSLSLTKTNLTNIECMSSQTVGNWYCWKSNTAYDQFVGFFYIIFIIILPMDYYLGMVGSLLYLSEPEFDRFNFKADAKLWWPF